MITFSQSWNEFTFVLVVTDFPLCRVNDSHVSTVYPVLCCEHLQCVCPSVSFVSFYFQKRGANHNMLLTKVVTHASMMGTSLLPLHELKSPRDTGYF